jgi:hypothetical protein
LSGAAGETARKSGKLYYAPVKFAVQPDCRPPARYFSEGITVNPGGLQYISGLFLSPRSRIKFAFVWHSTENDKNIHTI